MQFNLCDTSFIDWGAVAAVGTWAVGGAAIWIGFKANAIAVNLRRAEDARARVAASGMLTGLGLETMDYAHRLMHLAKNLQAIADDPGAEPEERVLGAIAAAKHAGLADIAARAPHLGHLPEDLHRRITFLYASERTLRASLAIMADSVEKLAKCGTDYGQELLRLTEEFAQRIGERSEGAFDTYDAIAQFQGLPPRDHDLQTS